MFTNLQADDLTFTDIAEGEYFEECDIQVLPHCTERARPHRVGSDAPYFSFQEYLDSAEAAGVERDVSTKPAAGPSLPTGVPLEPWMLDLYPIHDQQASWTPKRPGKVSTSSAGGGGGDEHVHDEEEVDLEGVFEALAAVRASIAEPTDDGEETHFSFTARGGAWTASHMGGPVR